MDRKEMDAFVTRMAQGRKAASAKRAVSNAPPSKKPAARSAGAPALNAVKPPKTKVPAPASKPGVTAPTAAIGPGPGGSKVTIHIH